MRPFQEKQSAFIEFKTTDDGVKLEKTIRDNRNELRKLKDQIHEHTEQCNATKLQIDKVKVELDRKTDERNQNAHGHMAAVDDDEIFQKGDGEDGQAEIIDEEELNLIQRMKLLKKNYRSTYADLKESK